MYRKILDNLRKWRNDNNKKTLLLDGTRQVGKTWVIEEFGKEYKTFIEINLIDDAKAKQFFEKSKSLEEILDFIELNNMDKDFSDEKEVLIFLDEIQNIPNLISMLKFFTTKCKYDVIASSSLLSVSLKTNISFPVGYVDHWTMHQLDFEEFLLAINLKEKYIETIKDCLNSLTPIPEAIHNKLLELFHIYMIIGGLPESVNRYIETGSLSESIKVLRHLQSDYINDIAVYADPEIRLKAISCYKSSPIQLAKENKKFQYKLVHSGYGAKHFDTSLNWLEMSGLIIKNTRLSKIEDPLEAYEELGIFKVYSFDTGLLLSNFDDAIISKALDDALGIYKGALYENITNQILSMNGYKHFYFEPNTSSEIDFITYYKGEITPIEVKAGLHTKSTSFNSFVDRYNCKYAFRFSQKNIGKDSNNIMYMPYYLIPFIFNNKQTQV